MIYEFSMVRTVILIRMRTAKMHLYMHVSEDATENFQNFLKVAVMKKGTWT